MTLLAPLALWLGVLIAVPLAVHLLRRRIGARVDFPAARYLARAEREHSRRLRLRNLLLMAVRVALVLALAAAAAGPVAGIGFGGGDSASHAPTAVAIVLDNSLSTSLIVNNEAVLDRLKQAARTVLSGIAARDRVWLLTVEGDVVAGDKGSVAEGLERVSAFAGEPRLDRVVARAGALLESASMPDRSIVVLTDAQTSTWSRELRVGSVSTTIYAPAIPVARNRSVASAAPEPVRWTPRGAIRARIAATDSVTYRVALAGRTLARGTAEADAAVVVTASPAERGWLTGSVEIEPDEMRADDVRHFGVWIGAPPSVSIDRATGPFVTNALAVLEEAGRATTGSGVAIVAAENLRSRPALVFAPSAPVQVGAANRALERAGIPWRFGALVSSRTTVSGEPLSGVEVTSRYRLQALAGARSDTLARAGMEPWIVAGDGFVIVGSVADPGSTTLPVRAAFVPWLADVLSQRLGSAPGPVSAAVAGSRIPVPRGAEALAGPDGARIPVRDAQIDVPRRTGGYRWLSGDTTVGVLAVNSDTSESRLDRLDSAALVSRVTGRKPIVISDVSALSSALFVSSSRRELAMPLVLLALLLVIAEAVLARERKKPATRVPALVEAAD